MSVIVPTRTEALASTIGGSLGISGPAGGMTHRCCQSSSSSGTAVPYHPFATLAARSILASPTCPRGRIGAGNGANHWAGQLAIPTSPRVLSALDAEPLQRSAPAMSRISKHRQLQVSKVTGDIERAKGRLRP
jgi:hypothetical protein